MLALLLLAVLHLILTPALCRERRQSDYWDEWEDWGECSRTCGGGITVRYRRCISQRRDGGSSCVGPDRAFRSCNIQDCPEGSRDFREEQCSQFDGADFQGKRYKWLPYYGAENNCELSCIPKGENFYYRHREAVVDGTPCHPGRRDVCVEGVCKPVGCDNMLESTQKEDPCLECGGTGKSCYPVRKTFTVLDLPKGYNQMFIIPVGATSILIREMAPTRNFLAIKNVRGEYYLNGHWVIDHSRAVHIASTVLHYERGAEGDLAPETIRGRGPTTEPLVIELISQEQNQGIEYEYYVPYRSSNEGYFWSYGSWSECSKECGSGYQSRLVFCIIDNEAYQDYLCSGRPRPASNRTCNPQPCPQTRRMAYLYRPHLWRSQGRLSSRVYSWKTGEWSACSATCDGGTQSRSVSCLIHDGSGSRVVEDAQCAAFSSRPSSQQACSLRQCASWSARSWSQCSVSCGEGEQTRPVVCMGTAGIRLPDYACSSLPKPETVRTCQRQGCPREIRWHIGDWGLCSKSCDVGLRERQVICADRDRNFYNGELCAADHKPSTTEQCNTQACFLPQSVPSMPDPRGYDNTRLGILVPYISEEPPTVYRRDEYREARGDNPWPDNRRSDTLYDRWVSQPQSCSESQYGCCPDGRTPASGPLGSGCPIHSCAETRYGCCPDGVTAAQGPDGAGCQTNTQHHPAAPRREPSEACRSANYGCCYDGLTLAAGPNGEGCPGQPNHSHPLACMLPNTNGPCSDWTARWFYDPSSGGCGRFWYGGCQGNRNNFATEEECLRECRGLATQSRAYGDRHHFRLTTLAERGPAVSLENSRAQGGVRLQGSVQREDRGTLTATDTSVRRVFTVHRGSEKNMDPHRGLGHSRLSMSSFIRPVASTIDRGLPDGQVQSQPRAEFVEGQHSKIHSVSTQQASISARQDSSSSWTLQDQGRGPEKHPASNRMPLPPKPPGPQPAKGPARLPEEGTTSTAPGHPEEERGGGSDGGDGPPRPARPAFQLPVGLVDSRTLQRLSIDKSGPSSVEGQMGQTVRLPCKVTPHSSGVTVEWRKDSQPISTPRHRQQADGSLLVGPLSSQDTGWLLCVASSDRERDHLYIYLSVSEDARSAPASQNPSVQQGSGQVSGSRVHRLSIDKSGPSSVEGRPGQTVRLPCRVSPTSVSVEWRRNDRPLTSARHTQQSDGSLVISRLSSEDSGFYTCTASNGQQRVHRQLQLRVLGDLRITTAPNNVQVSQGSSTQLPCVVSGSDVNVGWSRNGVPVRPDGRHVLLSADGSLILNNVQPSDEGSYTCNAYTGTYSVSATAEVKVAKGTELALPSRPNTAECIDQPDLANCDLIVYAKLCSSEYYSSFCCASCSSHSQPAGRHAEQG
nr:PREDICTED: papilin isoform X1 [Lepisosteus oculatus]XP_015206434.1 PREDICTED: papilin isoform X1 [Lepisosteus oculatus]